MKTLISWSLGFLLLSACASNTAVQNTLPAVRTDTLAGLQSIANFHQAALVERANLNRVRETALKETALSLGAQGGLAAEAEHINASLTQQSRTLDAVYDFTSLIIDHNILPPVLLEGRRILNIADTQTIRLADRTYKVAKQARFISSPPTWRQYLWMDYQKPDVPNVTLLPKTQEERAIWTLYINKGWAKGQEQAHTILQESVARIKEDFTGMILYRKLLAMNMVSPPFVSHTDLGVTGDSSEIHIDDQVLRITALPALNTNSQEWRVAVATEQQTIARLEALEQEAQDTHVMLHPDGWHPVIEPPTG